MKFVSFALVALSVGLAKSLLLENDDDKYDQEEVKSALQEIFNLTPDALKKECNVNFETAWPNIAASFENLQKMSDGFEAEAAQYFTEEDKNYGYRVTDNCRNSEPFKNEKMNLIKASLPCAKEDRVSELMKISEKNTC